MTVLLLTLVKNKKIQRELQKSKEKYYMLFNNIQVGFAMHEIICNEEGKPVDYRFLEMNQAFEEITGLKIKKVCYKTVREIMPEIEEYFITQYGEVALGGKSKEFEHYSRSLDKYFFIRAFSTERGKFVTSFTDITEQVYLREAIKKQKNILETILEGTLAGYWDFDFAHDTEYLSPAFKKMFGYNEDEVPDVPGTWQTLVDAQDLSMVWERINVHINSKGKIPYCTEVRYRHKNGNIVWVLCTGQVIEWDEKGKALRMVGCHVDITKQKNIQSQMNRILNEYRTVFNGTEEAILLVEVHDHGQSFKYVTSNKAHQEKTGLSLEVIQGKNPY